jgi:hypothetical protein
MLDWRAVDLGPARGLRMTNHVPYGRHVVVYGELEGRSFAAAVRADRSVVRMDDDVPGPVWSATSDEELLYTHGSPPVVSNDDWTCATGDADDPPVRGWIACGGSSAVTVTVSARGEVFQSEFDEEPFGGLWLAAPHLVDDLVVAGLEHGVVVAGRLGRSAEGATPSAWVSGWEEWHEVELSLTPDAWTAAYEGSGTLAGHYGQRPFVHGGTTPDVVLDSRHPMVDVLHDRRGWWPAPRDDERVCLALQALEGIQLWLPRPGGWTMLSGPPGRLAAGRLCCADRDVAWCLADDRLWVADLGAVWNAIDPEPG